MSKLRVYELSKELGLTSKDLIELLQEQFNINVKNHMSIIEDDNIAIIRNYINEANCTDFTLKKITVRNIKQFKNNTFDFTCCNNINTISGRNGSGKSTLFKCLTFVQKAFFIELLKENANYQNLCDELGKEMFSYFSGTDSYIEVEFKKNYSSLPMNYNIGLQEIASDSETSSAVIKLSATNISNEKVYWKLDYSFRDYIAIHKFWNISNPQNIIIYVESYKSIFEEDVKFDSINIKSDKKYYSSIVDTILNQDQIFNELYRNLINDYLYYRLVPPDSDGRRDIYYYATKVLFKHLFPNIDLKNFSGKTRDEQFILLATNKDKELFDIRNLSSGEKLVFYLLLFINYTGSLGILIIDEMENHLHEEIACKFLKILSEICNVDNYADYIIKKNRDLGTKSKLGDILSKNIFTSYSNFKLNQIFLLTHSKSLIYANFGLGKNFILKDKLELLDNNYERSLRDIGISYTYEKVLFVEGKTDSEALNEKLSAFNIKTKKLGNCTEVINTYKRILNIKEYIHDTKHVFLIDKDSRDVEDIEKLRLLDPKYFDESFICLQKHELENYFLDSKAILKVIKKHNDELEVDEECINKSLFEIATENKFASKRKYLNYFLDMKLDSLKSLINMREIDKSTSENMDSFIKYIDNKIINSSSFKSLREDLIRIFENCSDMFSEEVWKNEWSNLCDGKIVFNKFTSNYAPIVGLTNVHFKNNITKAVVNDSESEFNKLVTNIIEYF